ncbi:MAG TPA: biotin/lipoyl-containing protein [Anaerolineales bacterium]|nr:biotin/lipoyl-containing protein [Anaerolineales bacterium]
MKYLTTIGDKTYTIEINDDRHVSVDGQTYTIDFEAISAQSLFSLLVDGKSFEGFVENDGDEWRVILRGDLYEARVIDERAARLAKSAGGVAPPTGDFHLKAPMPGLVVAAPVTEGQPVKKGDILVILESMKMQNELKSPRDGTVARVKVKGGDTVEQNQVMMTIAGSE